MRQRAPYITLSKNTKGNYEAHKKVRRFTFSSLSTPFSCSVCIAYKDRMKVKEKKKKDEK